MDLSSIAVIVIGSLNTDIVALGVDELLSPGELTRGGRLHIGPGGKSRNMAQMTASLAGAGRVAMIGRTSRDPYRLWEIPVSALAGAGVNTDYLTILDFEETGQMPGVALIPVNRKGENQIYCIPGISDSFCPGDIDRAEPLFRAAAKNRGILALSLELPLETAIHAVKKACGMGLTVVLDPGGIARNTDYGELLGSGIFLVKPNEHEAAILTGIEVTGLSSARKAAEALMKKGIEYVFITLGARGAYLFGEGKEKHLPVPALPEGNERDETGCGDQVTAALCAELIEGRNIQEAAGTAMLAGTMQYYRAGIRPVTGAELKDMKKRNSHE